MGHIIDIGTARQLLIDSKRLGGHVDQRHTGISNDGLMARLYNGDGARNGKVQWISAFLNMSDTAQAAAETLRTWADDKYNAIINNRIPQDEIIADTNSMFQARFAFGSGVRTLRTNKTTMIVRATPEGLRFMIHTFFPRPPYDNA